MSLEPAIRRPRADNRVELLGGMKLTRKFIAALVIGVAIVALIQGFFDFRREREVFDKQMRAEATALGRALARGMAEVWARDGEATAREFLLMASSKSEFIKARWVWLDARTDPPHASREALEPMTQGNPVTIKDQDSNSLLTYIPVEVPRPPPTVQSAHEIVSERREGGIEIAQNLADLDKYTTDSLRNQIFGTISQIVVAAALALVLGMLFIGRPVSRLAAKARRVGTGDLTGPLKLRQRDELGELATEINLMCDRLADERSAREAATDQLRHADRLTTVGKLASGIAHELGTPLNVVSGRARLIRDGEVDGAEAGRLGANRRRASRSHDRDDPPVARFRAPACAPEVAGQRHQPRGARDRARRDDLENRAGRDQTARTRRHAAGRGG